MTAVAARTPADSPVTATDSTGEVNALTTAPSTGAEIPSRSSPDTTPCRATTGVSVSSTADAGAATPTATPVRARAATVSTATDDFSRASLPLRWTRPGNRNKVKRGTDSLLGKSITRRRAKRRRVTPVSRCELPDSPQRFRNYQRAPSMNGESCTPKMVPFVQGSPSIGRDLTEERVELPGDDVRDRGDTTENHDPFRIEPVQLGSDR